MTDLHTYMLPKKVQVNLDKYAEKFSAVEERQDKFFGMLDKAVSFSKSIFRQMAVGNILREYARPGRVYVALANIPVEHDGVLQFPLLDLYALNALKWSPEDSIKWYPASDADIMPDIYEMVSEKEWEDSFREYVKKITEPVDPDQPKRGRPPKKKVAPVPAKKKPKPTPKPKPKPKEDISEEEYLETQKQTVEELGKLMEEEKLKESARKREDTIASMRESLIFSLTHEKGYSEEEASEYFDTELADMIGNAADRIVTKKESLESSIKKIARYIEKNVKKRPPRDITKPKPKPAKKDIGIEKQAQPTVYTSMKQAIDILTMGCFWIMGRYNQSTERAYRNCQKVSGTIGRLAEEMYAGEKTLIDATAELENAIIETVDLTVSDVYKSADKPLPRDEMLSTVQASKRQKIRARQDVAVAAQVRKFKQFGKFDPRGELRHLPGTDALSLRVQEAPLKLIFQGAVMPRGLSHEEKEQLRTEFDETYLQILRDEFGIRIVRSPDGFVAFFDLKYLADGSIVAEQDGNEFSPFNKLVENLQTRFSEEECIVVERYFFTEDDRARIR